ncbi:MAG TPA: ABC transporter substrate-binding protein [Gaiellaceae bacterium]|nr:ABC transporter substrate-binding protein [Gaiellaceae bacterium]
MLRRIAIAVLAVGVATAVVAGVAAAGVSGKHAGMPTVKLMVGGIDKQIYLPYQLAQGLGYYKKYGVDVKLSTEQDGGVGAEEAMVSGQVDMAGAWYLHTIDFQVQGKAVVDVVQLSGAPGEREVCATGSGIHSPADFKGKSLGVTDLGSGTDALTEYMAVHAGLKISDIHRVAVGAGDTLIAALQHGSVQCAMTSQPTVSAVVKKGVGYSAVDLATGKGVKRNLGGFWPTASVIARADWVASHKDAVQRVVTALVATMHYIHTHSAAQIANHLPKDFVQNALVTRADYVKALSQDKGQFLPNGLMPKGGPQTVLAVERLAGLVKPGQKVKLAPTYTNAYVLRALKRLGLKK